MNTDKLSLLSILTLKLALYKNKHGGHYPARIFMTERALLELVRANAAVATSDLNAPHKAFGVPVCAFYGEGAAFYLSDEEA